jgi:hypothetical protein
VKVKESRSLTHDEQDAEAHRLEEQQVDTLEGSEDDNLGSKKRRKIDLKL